MVDFILEILQSKPAVFLLGMYVGTMLVAVLAIIVAIARDPGNRPGDPTWDDPWRGEL